jgi:hypothetical protein
MATLKWTGPAAYVSLLNSIRAFRSDLMGLDPSLAPDELEALVSRQDALALDFTRTVLYTSHCVVTLSVSRRNQPQTHVLTVLYCKAVESWSEAGLTTSQRPNKYYI